MDELATWISSKLDELPEYSPEDLEILLWEARNRAAKAGLPTAVRAATIRPGLVAKSLAREILAECLAECRTVQPPQGSEPQPLPEGPWTVKQAAKALNVSERTVRDLVKSGKLKSHRVGAGRGVVRILPADVEEFQRAAAPEPPQTKPLPRHW